MPKGGVQGVGGEPEGLESRSLPRLDKYLGSCNIAKEAKVFGKNGGGAMLVYRNDGDWATKREEHEPNSRGNAGGDYLKQ